MAAPSPRLAPVTSAAAPWIFMDGDSFVSWPHPDGHGLVCGLSVGSALLLEERERFGDELVVELEDAAVAGVRVDNQIRIR